MPIEEILRNQMKRQIFYINFKISVTPGTDITKCICNYQSSPACAKNNMSKATHNHDFPTCIPLLCKCRNKHGLNMSQSKTFNHFALVFRSLEDAKKDCERTHRLNALKTPRWIMLWLRKAHPSQTWNDIYWTKELPMGVLSVTITVTIWQVFEKKWVCNKRS